MKLFSLLKIPGILLGLGALLFFTPSCRAQSEISPDHFDGMDPWEVAARKPLTPKILPAPTPASDQAQNKRAGSGASVQLAAVRDLSDPALHGAVAAQDKRKPMVRRSDKK